MTAQDYERESIREYVQLEAPDEQVTHVEQLTTRHVLDDHYEIWDVWTDKSRWWVISPLTNLYLQEDFHSLDMAFACHLGVMQMLMTRGPDPTESEKARALGAWRKWDRAHEELERGEEAEDFQAVGMRLREGLIAFVQELAKDDYVPEGEPRPQSANIVRWTELIAEHLAPGDSNYSVRSFLKDTSKATWQLVSWLTHAANATRSEAKIAAAACDQLAGCFLTMEVMREKGAPSRCPKCNSYRLASKWRVETKDYVLICEVCAWQDRDN